MEELEMSYISSLYIFYTPFQTLHFFLLNMQFKM